MEEGDWQFLLWMVFRIMVAFFSEGNFHKWFNVLSNNCYIFSTFFPLELLQWSCHKLYVPSMFFCWKILTEMPRLDRNEKFKFENCGAQTTKITLSRDRKKSSFVTLFCTQCLIFSTKSENDLNYHFAKHHSDPKSYVTLKCTLCYQDFPGYYALR